MVERARELSVRILGVDGFWLSERTTQPDMEHSLDVSGDPDYGWDQAAAFLQDRADTGLMVEVVDDE